MDASLSTEVNQVQSQTQLLIQLSCKSASSARKTIAEVFLISVGGHYKSLSYQRTREDCRLSAASHFQCHQEEAEVNTDHQVHSTNLYAGSP